MSLLTDWLTGPQSGRAVPWHSSATIGCSGASVQVQQLELDGIFTSTSALWFISLSLSASPSLPCVVFLLFVCTCLRTNTTCTCNYQVTVTRVLMRRQQIYQLFFHLFYHFRQRHHLHLSFQRRRERQSADHQLQTLLQELRSCKPTLVSTTWLIEFI